MFTGGDGGPADAQNKHTYHAFLILKVIKASTMNSALRLTFYLGMVIVVNSNVQVLLQ